MKNQKEVKNLFSSGRKSPKGTLKKKIVSTRVLLMPLIVFSSILTLTASCNESKHGNKSKAESTNRGQGSARVSREKVINYLQKLHLIDDPMNYKVELTNEYLYIDGNKQPEKTHLHIIKNFVENPNGHLQVTYTVATD